MSRDLDDLKDECGFNVDGLKKVDEEISKHLTEYTDRSPDFHEGFIEGHKAALESHKEKMKILTEMLEKSDRETAKLVEALEKLGHYGIDFGYGKFECDVAKVAQEALKEWNEK
jgi:hypothetical protein